MVEHIFVISDPKLFHFPVGHILKQGKKRFVVLDKYTGSIKYQQTAKLTVTFICRPLSIWETIKFRLLGRV